MESEFVISSPSDEIKQAIITSLVCRKARNESDKEEGKAGWWGDYLDESNREIGSFLWTLERSILNEQVLNLAKNYAYESLSWLKEEKILDSIEVSTEAKENIMRMEIRCY